MVTIKTILKKIFMTKKLKLKFKALKRWQTIKQKEEHIKKIKSKKKRLRDKIYD
jgi:hypothetical protein